MRKQSTKGLGFPISYGDTGPDYNIFELKDKENIGKIILLSLVMLPLSATPAFACAGKKAAAESTRAAACAAAGACLTIAAQQSKCGNMTPATAAFCGAMFAMCIEKTAAMISNS